jgi:hypothetical protein
MIFLAQLILYLLAVAGVIASALGAMFFLGGALNRARTDDVRRRRAALGALCALGIVASAALGFVGVPAILYLASR